MIFGDYGIDIYNFSDQWEDFLGGYHTARCSYDAESGLVILNGVIRHVGAQAPLYDDIIGQLDVEQAPPVRSMFLCKSSNGFVRVDVAADGYIRYRGDALPKGGFISLGGIVYNSKSIG